MVVGARCAGSTLARALAQRGWDVLLVDRDPFPSDTVSTHFTFPNTLARFEQLGVLDRLRAAHDVPLVGAAGHFKHPGTAQGINDAVEQALHVAEALSGSRPSLDGYERWRDERARALLQPPGPALAGARARLPCRAVMVTPWGARR